MPLLSAAFFRFELPECFVELLCCEKWYVVVNCVVVIVVVVRRCGCWVVSCALVGGVICFRVLVKLFVKSGEHIGNGLPVRLLLSVVVCHAWDQFLAFA